MIPQYTIDAIAYDLLWSTSLYLFTEQILRLIHKNNDDVDFTLFMMWNLDHARAPVNT